MQIQKPTLPNFVAVLSVVAFSQVAFASVEFPPFKLGLSSQIVAAGFDLAPKPPGPISNKLSYRPAQSNYAGIILGYRWISGTLSFAIPADPSIRDVEGVSQYRDYRLSYYSSQFGAEASYSRYKGYLINNSSDLQATTLAGQRYFKIPDLETLGYGITLFYVPSPGDFSLPASLDQSALQEKSGGAWLILATWRQQSITSGNAWIPAERTSDFGADGMISQSHTSNFGVGGGYGYNVVWGRFFLSPVLAVGGGYQSVDYVLQSGSPATYASAAFNAHVRLSAGINSPHFFLVADLYADRFSEDTKMITVGASIFGLTLSTGVRF